MVHLLNESYKKNLDVLSSCSLLCLEFFITLTTTLRVNYTYGVIVSLNRLLKHNLIKLMVINTANKVSSSFAYMYQSLQGLSLKVLTR